MNRKSVCLTVMVMVFMGAFGSAVDGKSVEASETIYIRADGSIDPPQAPFVTDDNVTYTLSDDIYGEIVVERDNIAVNGVGYTLQGLGDGIGITLFGRVNVTIRDMNIKDFQRGIYLSQSTNNTISGNDIASSVDAVYLYYSQSNDISANNITSNSCGVYIHYYSHLNRLSENNMVNNSFGIYLDYLSHFTSIFGNNITSNGRGIEAEGPAYYGSYSNISGNYIADSGDYGIRLYSCSNNSVSRNTFVNDGLFVWDSHGNSVMDNQVNGKPLDYLENVSDVVVEDAGQVILVNCNRIRVENLSLSFTSVGVQLWKTNNSRISGNNIANNSDCGIVLAYSSNNSISGNSITNSYGPILLYSSSNNTVYHNNFLDNKYPADNLYDSVSAWDDGYPSGGNYWNDYGELDTDCDGIGNTPYLIHTNSADRYPLVVPLGPIPVVWNRMIYMVELKSNSTISRFQLNALQEMLGFNVTGQEGTFGFCNITIPNSLVHDLWRDDFTVLVDGNEPIALERTSDSTNTYVYIIYLHSDHKVAIIPEFPSFLSLPLLMIAASLAVIVYRRRH